MNRLNLLTILAIASLLIFEISCRKKKDEPQVPAPPTGVGIEMIAENFTAPVALVEAPDETNRLFVVDQVGEIKIINAEGNVLQEPFLEIKGKVVNLNPAYDERGLLGLAFHPDYKSNGVFYVYYSAPVQPGTPSSYNHTSIVAEYKVSGGNANLADKGSERILMQIPEPQMNHNGGTLLFGPDRMLYISLGDGGGANDNEEGHVTDWYVTNEGGNGQDITDNWLGSILRIDVNGSPYSVPGDNPFVGEPGLDEIYAFGFRNPYRASFDMGGDHKLIVGDAGQALWEEVSVVEKGGNYGWNVKEGSHCFNASDNTNSFSSCPTKDSAGRDLVNPVIEFKNSNHFSDGLGTVVVGGYVYRGDDLINWDGRYICGAWSKGKAPSGQLFYSDMTVTPWTINQFELEGEDDGELSHYLLGLGQDAKGEVYVLTTDLPGPTGNTGKVFKLVMK